MKNIAGIYGDIKGRSFEFLHFFAMKILKGRWVSYAVRNKLLQALKTADFDAAVESWRGIIGSQTTDEALLYIKEHTPYRFTDDTILTIATMEALLESEDEIPDFAPYYHRWANKYSESGFGGQFRDWMKTPLDEARPYNSFGNGSAMRVGPIGYRRFENINQLIDAVTESACCTHNSPEGIRGARAVAEVVFLSRNGYSKEHIKERIEGTYFYDLRCTVADIRKRYKFDATCQGSVSESIICFLESTDVESAIDLSISLGGDADTMAMMAGSMAEALYGKTPEHMLVTVKQALPDEMFDIIEAFNVNIVGE